MAEVTVYELAKAVGAPVERLLKQIKDAGLPQKSSADLVTDFDKQALLAFLKSAHEEGPRKITLQTKKNNYKS